MDIELIEPAESHIVGWNNDCETVDLRYDSEFFQRQQNKSNQVRNQDNNSGLYDIAFVCTAYREAIESAYNLLKTRTDLLFSEVLSVVIHGFNKYISEKISHHLFDEIVQINKGGIEKLKELRPFQQAFLADRVEDNPQNYVDSLIESYCAVITAFEKRRIFFDSDLAENYLDSFFELCRGMVFSTNNFNLTSSGFRKSFFLRTLLSFAAKREEWKVLPDTDCNVVLTIPEEKQKIYPYTYSFFDPFAYDMIERALKCAARLLFNECPVYEDDTKKEFFALRVEMLVCSLESAFQRNITLDHQSYRIELNRHTSRLCAYPLDFYSSTSGTKPVRLFEKTASYISHYLLKNLKASTNDIIVTVIGHVAVDDQARKNSLSDYMGAVLTWYNEVSKDKKKPPLRLDVQVIQNLLYRDRKKKQEKKEANIIRVEWKEHSARCKFISVDYESQFAYSLKHIKDYIDRSHILFLLDCPWLSTENYSIRDEGALGNYCDRLQKQQRAYAMEDIFSETDSKRFYEASPMMELSNQLNRIMSSSSKKAGPVVRSMRDDLIHALQEYMDRLRSKQSNLPAKELYVFSSENDGINYSYIDAYPLTRLEQYDGKHFTIIQFSNKRMHTLPWEWGSIQFEIDLWSVLKYLCIPYAYQHAVRDLLIKNGFCVRESKEEKGVEASIQYLEALQNIIIHFDVSPNLKNIYISLGYTERFIYLLELCVPLNKRQNNENKEGEIQRKEVQRKVNAIMESVLALVKPLYLESVFAKNKKYADDAIKLGFMMTLYSAAQDVSTMLFYHVYSKACKTGDFSRFNIRIELQKHFSPYKPRNFRDEFFFSEKKLYCTLLDTFETDYRLSLGMIRMIKGSNMSKDSNKFEYISDLFETNDTNKSVLWRLLDNIKRACEQAGLEESKLYFNLLRARYYLEG